VFLVFFKSAAIEAKIKKIADAFGAKRYPVPGTIHHYYLYYKHYYY
jgi:hypothetical protein